MEIKSGTAMRIGVRRSRAFHSSFRSFQKVMAKSYAIAHWYKM